MDFSYMPRIPDGLLHRMEEIRKADGRFEKDEGGQWVDGPEERIPFQGVVLPVSDKDLQYGLSGTFGKLSEKIYTNGHSLKLNGKVFDPQSGTTYTVKQELGHNSLHPLKRYIVESRGEADK